VCSIGEVTAAGDSFVGLQEVLDNQLNDIMDSMKGNGAWERIGVARDDGDNDGEYNPILYRTDVFELLHEETKWLSETPDEPSKSWDSGSNRIITLGVFKHIATGRVMIMANTHLDNAVAEARVNQIRVAVDIIQAVDARFGPNLPTFLTGDFNSVDTDGAYTTLVAENYLQDLYAVASPEQRSERFFTYTGFAGEFASRIDYIWFGPQVRALVRRCSSGRCFEFPVRCLTVAPVCSLVPPAALLPSSSTRSRTMLGAAAL